MLKTYYTCFAHTRRGRCQCCNRQQTLKGKIIIQDDAALVGDLNLCSECVIAWLEILGKGSERVIQEWNFNKE